MLEPEKKRVRIAEEKVIVYSIPGRESLETDQPGSKTSPSFPERAYTSPILGQSPAQHASPTIPSQEQRNDFIVSLFQADFRGQATTPLWQNVRINAPTLEQAQKVCDNLRTMIVSNQKLRKSNFPFRDAHATAERHNKELARELTKKTADLENILNENRRLRTSIKKLEKAMDAMSGALEHSNMHTQTEGADITPTTAQKALKTVIMEGVTEYNGAIMAHSCGKFVINYRSLSAILMDDVPNHKGDEHEDEQSSEGATANNEDTGDVFDIDEGQMGVQE